MLADYLTQSSHQRVDVLLFTFLVLDGVIKDRRPFLWVLAFLWQVENNINIVDKSVIVDHS